MGITLVAYKTLTFYRGNCAETSIMKTHDQLSVTTYWILF